MIALVVHPEIVTAWSDERAVSTTVGYAISVAVATLLVTGLLVAGGTFLSDHREQTTRSELRVIGEQIAADISAADRLARTENVEEVVLKRNIPQDVAGGTYTVTLTDVATDPRLVLKTNQPDVTVEVDVVSRTPLVPSKIQGGKIRVFYDPNTVELEVKNG